MRLPRIVSCCPAERFYSLRIGENRLFCQSTNPLPAFLRQKIPDSAQKCQIGDLVFSCIYSPIIFANNTISGIAMMVLSRKITSSFQKFNGISLLLTLPTAKAGGFLFLPPLHWQIPYGTAMSYTVSTGYIYTVPACPAVQFSYLYADCSCSPFFKILMPAFVSRS